jgi:DNA polymerase III alpha subunit (gram-positive type)
MANNPRGFITKLLAIDVETTGLAFNMDDPSHNPNTGETFQAISYGIIVVDAVKLIPIEELYIEVQWDGTSTWSPQAEKVHGLSKQHLIENGMSKSDAVEQIANLLISHWGPSSPIHILGHNPSFDLVFLKRDLRSEGLEIKFGSKIVDTNSIGFAVYNTHNSDDLFEMVGMDKRSDHNALDHARSALKVLQTTRLIATECFGG